MCVCVCVPTGLLPEYTQQPQPHPHPHSVLERGPCASLPPIAPNSASYISQVCARACVRVCEYLREVEIQKSKIILAKVSERKLRKQSIITPLSLILSFSYTHAHTANPICDVEPESQTAFYTLSAISHAQSADTVCVRVCVYVCAFTCVIWVPAFYMLLPQRLIYTVGQNGVL